MRWRKLVREGGMGSERREGDSKGGKGRDGKREGMPKGRWEGVTGEREREGLSVFGREGRKGWTQ